MKVELLDHTREPEKIVAAAGRLCYYNKADIDTLMHDLTPDKINDMVTKLAAMHHESPFEHCSFTFGIEGVSRALTHQLVRHRIASYDQRSQRYCAEGNFEAVLPATIEKNDEARIAFRGLMADTNNVYQKLVALGIPKEDARMVLPNACETKILVTMNARSLYHFFNLRCCTRAQWEIRDMANEMLVILKKDFPILFGNAGPSCVNGFCPEEDKCCGRAPTLQELLETYSNAPAQNR
jgi:thymidylate synthase (FAD)